MIDNTKYNNLLNSIEKQPIQHEIPQIRNFYNKHCQNLYECTPMNKKTILKLMQTPGPDYTNIMMEKQLASIRKSDLFCSLVDSGVKYSSPSSLKYQLSRRFESTLKKSINKGFSHMADLYNNQNFLFNLGVNDNRDEQMLSFADKVLYGNFCENIFGNSKSPIRSKDSLKNKDFNNIKKRKRKSNLQLKILKMEYQKDEFWSKEKIVTIAKMTGLTESQVYKWCWDQKKKIEDSPKLKQTKNLNLNGQDIKANQKKFKSKMEIICLKEEQNKENINDENNFGNILKFSKKIIKHKTEPTQLRKYRKHKQNKEKENGKRYIRNRRMEKNVLADMTNKIMF